jgi:glucose-6-phosphate-specific signal transduction histidine kinase
MLLLCVSAASGAMATLIQNPTKTVAQSLFPIGVTVGLCIAISARRNWARWVYTALIVLTWLAVVTDLTTFSSTPLTWPRIIAWAGTVLEISALVLLFTGPASRWFRQRRNLQRTVS